MSFKEGGLSMEDRLRAFKYFCAGQHLSFVVLKATTSELIGPKKKHLKYLISVTNETNVSIPSLTKYLMKRAKHHEWSVSFKSLITIHHLMSYGNERFIQNLASSTVNNRYFDHLANYMDRSSTLAYDMSTFLRRYSYYVNAKIHTYRSLGLDFCRLIANSSKKGEFKTTFRNLSIEKLLITLPILQEQFDDLIAFDPSPNDLNNGIINSAFSSLYKDFVKLYIAYQTAILRLLELFFPCQQLKRAQELFDAYKKFLVRMDKVSDFVRVIDSVGMDRSDMPKLTKAPSLSLPLLEKHLKELNPTSKEGRRIDLTTTTRWQPLELINISSNALGNSGNLKTTTTTRRRRSDLLSPTSIKRLPNASVVEIPRIKSPETVVGSKKQKQRRSIQNNTPIYGKDKQIVGSTTLKTECDITNDDDDATERKQANPLEANQTLGDLLLIDNNNNKNNNNKTDEDKDLILMSDDDDDEEDKECFSAAAGCNLINGQTSKQTAPSDWVQV